MHCFYILNSKDIERSRLKAKLLRHFQIVPDNKKRLLLEAYRWKRLYEQIISLVKEYLCMDKPQLRLGDRHL